MKKKKRKNNKKKLQDMRCRVEAQAPLYPLTSAYVDPLPLSSSDLLSEAVVVADMYLSFLVSAVSHSLRVSMFLLLCTLRCHLI